MRRAALLLAGLGLAGCSVFDPHIPVGPEAGYCFAAQGIRGGSAFDGCPDGTRRHVAWAGERTPGIHLDETLAFLRDRRRRMAEREAELARIAAGTRAGAFGGALAAAGGAVLGAANNFIAAASFGAAGSLAANQGFATQGMRDVYNAGVAALSCVEARAMSARSAPFSGPWVNDVAKARRDLDAALSGARANPPEDGQTPEGNDYARAIRDGVAALASLDALLAAANTGALSGPAIANAVFDRTLAIVIQVNHEIDRATPSAEAVMALARGAGTVGVSPAADIAGTADGAARNSMSGAGAAESQPARAAASAANTARGAPPDGGAVAALGTLNMALVEASAAARSAAQAAAAANIPPSISVRACAFQIAGGDGMTLSPARLVLERGKGSETVVVTGGRPPYRISATGAVASGFSASPEYSPGSFAIARSAGRTGSATFLVSDQAGQQQVLTVEAR
jgi:hypothetical protein